MSISSGGSKWRRSLTPGLVAATIQAVLVALVTGAKLCEGTEDTDLYFRFASLLRRGKVPYRDFLVEYPPLALPAFLSPALFARDLVAYKVAFAAEMLFINALAVLLVAMWVERREGSPRVAVRLAWYTGFALILGRLIVTRYDAAPMLVGFAATLGGAAGRPALGGLLGAAGTLLKVYPAAPTLVALLADRHRGRGGRYRGAIAFGLTLVGGGLTWLGVGGVRGVAESLRFQADRELEYGSLYSGGQMLAAKLLGATITIGRDHSSFSTSTPWSEGLLKIVFPIQAAAVIGVCWVFARRGRRELVRYSAAAVLAFIATNKVFSPQFLIWLIPYMAVLEGPVGRRGRWLFLATCGATLLAPAGLSSLPRTSLWIILAYNVRNVLVAWLLLVLVFGPAAPDSDAADETGRTRPDQPEEHRR